VPGGASSDRRLSIARRRAFITDEDTMIAACFSPSDIESLVRIAGTLADSPSAADLSRSYRVLATRARAVMLAETSGHPAPAVSALLGPRPGEQVWMLRIWDRHEDSTSPYATEATALAELADYVRGKWDNLYGEEGVPEQPPADDAEAVDYYYGPGRGGRPDEGYELYAEEIIRPRRSRVVPLDFAFPDAAEAAALNRAAIFHPGDEDGPPCTELLGVLTFTYLDAKDGVLRISVHLDSADPERIVRPDGTVPLRVVVEDTVVLDDSQAGAPHPTVLEALLASADAAQTGAICEAAVSAGFMWRCPVCRWPNPRAATCCEGPGDCRVPQPATTGQQAISPMPDSVLALEGPR